MVALVRGSIVRAGVSQAARRAASVRLLSQNGPIAQLRMVPHMQQTRSMGLLSGIRDTVTTKMQERNDIKQAEAYREQVNSLAYSSKFDLNSFAEQLQKNADMAGLNGWKSYIPGVNEMTAVQQIKAFLKILEHVDPELRENPRLITGKAKRIISEKSGQSAEEINNMLRNFEQLSALRLWLVKRVERGLRLPETMQETQELVREDPTGFPSKKFRMKPRRY